MTKRSQKRPSRTQAGCLWSLLSIFAFRHGRSTRRLLSDRKQANKQIIGPGQSSNQMTEKCEDAMHPATAEATKTSVKELMEVEMFNEQRSTENQSNESEISLDQISSTYKNHTNENQKRRSRSSIKSCDMDVNGFDAAECLLEHFNQDPEQKQLSKDLDLEKIMDELSQISQKKIDCSKHDKHGDLDIPSGQGVTVVEEKLAAVIKMVIEGRLSSSKHSGEEGNTFCSKDFMDALQTLSLNKGLFLKLLQDSNSALVKHIQDLEDGQVNKGGALISLPGSNLSEENPVNLKSDECSSRKHRSFFRRRSKSMDSCPSGGDKDSQTSNKIVVWNPGQAGAQSSQNGIVPSNSSLEPHYVGKGQNDRNASQFSFTEIKRRLRLAIGKDRQGIPPDRVPIFPPKHQRGNNGNKGSTGESFGWSSPNRNHFYTERFTVSSPRKGEPFDKAKDKSFVVVNETRQYHLCRSNLYIEAKKHLSEMLENGDENVESVAGQLHKSLGRILSLPEYNGSTCCSPRNRDDDILVTAQMRLSPRGTGRNNVGRLLQENNNDYLSPRRQTLEIQPRIAGIISQSEAESESPNMNADVPVSSDLKCHSEFQCFPKDTATLEVSETEEREKLELQEEEMINNLTSESSSTSLGGDWKEGTSEVDNEETEPQILKETLSSVKSDLYEEEQSSPSHSAASTNVNDSDHGSKKSNQPSPISILEPLFTDDDISPASTVSRSAEKEILPRHINFEEQSTTSEQGICTGISLEGEESAFEYVEAVLLGSGLNWDDFLSRWLSSYEILDSSLFDEVELFSSRPRHDQKLLFDCANESLKEACASYFGCFSGISHNKPNSRSVPKGMDLIHEIWKRVEEHLLHSSQPLSLDQLVKIDLAASGKWMSIQSDINLIGSEMEETIFDEFLDDFVMSFIDDISEVESSVLQDEPESESKAIEVTAM